MLKRRFVIAGLFFILLIAGAHSQNDFRVMFYNVENLFDTRDDPLKDDDDFLADGFMHWTPWKYWEKLRNITKVITAVGGMQSPALVGLCEVENDSVIFDLTKRSPLRAQEYEYIISHSPDERGIDVALLYQRHQFKLLESTEYEIAFRGKNRRPTRNILHAVGSIINGDTLDVLVCHFPSRSNGKLETEQARIESATVLRNRIDSLYSSRTNANILIMGDFNDHPDDKSLSHILKAKEIPSQDRRNKWELYNLFYHHRKERDFGSYKYRGRWEILDQFIVNGAMLMEGSSIQVKNNEALIYKEEFLLEQDEKYYGMKPFRTNLGPRYNKGFSDHLPIYMDLSIRNESPANP